MPLQPSGCCLHSCIWMLFCRCTHPHTTVGSRAWSWVCSTLAEASAQDPHLPLAPDGAAAAFGIIVEQAADCCIVKAGWTPAQALACPLGALAQHACWQLPGTNVMLSCGCRAGALQGQAAAAAGRSNSSG